MNLRSQSNTKCICGSLNYHQFSKYSNVFHQNVEYHKCCLCGLVVAPASKRYDLTKIYNDTYFIDVDYGWEERSQLILKFISVLNLSLNLKQKQICDYGAGNGYLTKSLIDLGYNVLAYEPFISKEQYLCELYYITEPFEANVLLMIEVFEHFTDAVNEFSDILERFNYPNFLIFTTEIIENSKGNIENWYYLNPDAGHFTIWSQKSLKTLGKLEGYRLISFAHFFHVLCKDECTKEYIMLKLESEIYNIYVSLKNHFKK